MNKFNFSLSVSWHIISTQGLVILYVPPSSKPSFTWAPDISFSTKFTIIHYLCILRGGSIPTICYFHLAYSHHLLYRLCYKCKVSSYVLWYLIKVDSYGILLFLVQPFTPCRNSFHLLVSVFFLSTPNVCYHTWTLAHLLLYKNLNFVSLTFS